MNSNTLVEIFLKHSAEITVSVTALHRNGYQDLFNAARGAGKELGVEELGETSGGGEVTLSFGTESEADAIRLMRKIDKIGNREFADIYVDCIVT